MTELPEEYAHDLDRCPLCWQGSFQATLNMLDHIRSTHCRFGANMSQSHSMVICPCGKHVDVPPRLTEYEEFRKHVAGRQADGVTTPNITLKEIRLHFLDQYVQTMLAIDPKREASV